jgi:hypothetical protein
VDSIGHSDRQLRLELPAFSLSIVTDLPLEPSQPGRK